MISARVKQTTNYDPPMWYYTLTLNGGSRHRSRRLYESKEVAEAALVENMNLIYGEEKGNGKRDTKNSKI